MKPAGGSTSGLVILRSGESVESVTTKSGVFRLLASLPGVELHLGTLVKGKQLNLVPFDGSPEGASEAYYVLRGSLRASPPTGPIRVGQGDLILAESLTEPVIFETTEEVEFLYISNRPTFHQVSGQLRELMRLAAEVETRDAYSAGHCLRIQKLAFATGKELGLPHPRLYLLEYGSYLHDLGNLRLPRAMLVKRGALTAEEWVEMKRHPGYGKDMLRGTFIPDAGLIVEQHHERLDGSGYPQGLRGDQIQVEASIVGVVDTFDAMTTERPYRPAATREQALSELEDSAGALFPRDVVSAFRTAESASRWRI